MKDEPTDLERFGSWVAAAGFIAFYISIGVDAFLTPAIYLIAAGAFLLTVAGFMKKRP